jgi:hypothetical protein
MTVRNDACRRKSCEVGPKFPVRGTPKVTTVVSQAALPFPLHPSDLVSRFRICHSLIMGLYVFFIRRKGILAGQT